MRITGIASLIAITALSGAAHTAGADEVLNLELPPSPAAQARAIASRPAPRPAAEKPRSNSFMEYSRQRAAASSMANKRFASRGRRQEEEKVVGRLGLTLREAAIRQARNSSRVLAKVENGTYVALSRDFGDWYGVVMADKSTGWIRKSDIRLLDFEVTASKGYEEAPPSAPLPGGQDPVLTGPAKAILDTAYTYLGVPYKWGGTSTEGMDCSAFVQRCFRAAGFNLPRTSREQINVGMPVDTSQLQAGDRLYFGKSNGYITHTGIYMGNGYFIHSSSSRKGVAISQLSEPMYQRIYAGARR